MGSVGATGGALGATWGRLVGSQVIAKLFKPGLGQLGGSQSSNPSKDRAQPEAASYVTVQRLDLLDSTPVALISSKLKASY